MNSKGLFRAVPAAVVAGLLTITGFGQGFDDRKVNSPSDTAEMRVALAASEDAYYHGAGRMGRPVQVRATGEEHRNLCYVTPIYEGWVWPQLTHVDPSEGDDEVRVVKEVADKLRERLPSEAKVLSTYGFKRACVIVATTDGTQITGGGVAFVFLVTPEGLTEITKQYLGQHGSPTEAVVALMKGEPKKSQ